MTEFNIGFKHIQKKLFKLYFRSDLVIIVSSFEACTTYTAYTRFFIKNTFISKTRLKLAKNQANTKQHPEAELLLFRIVHIIIRSSRLGLFSEKGVLRNFTKFTGKHVCQSLFFNKASSLCQSLFFNSFMTEAVII